MRQEGIALYENNKTLRIYSGIAAVALYFIFLFVFSMQNKNEEKSGDNILISNVIFQDDTQYRDSKPSLPKKEIETPQPTPAPPPQVEEIKEVKAPPPEPKKEVSSENLLGDVFSNVPSQINKEPKKEEIKEIKKEIKIEKPPVTTPVATNNVNKSLDEISKSLESGIKDTLNIQVNTATIGNSSQGNTNGNDKDALDGWFDGIQKTLMSEWKKTKKYSKATSATVKVRIDSKGRLSYLLMVTPSPFSDYNASVEHFIKQMEKSTFPPVPNGSDLVFSINLKSEGF